MVHYRSVDLVDDSWAMTSFLTKNQFTMIEIDDDFLYQTLIWCLLLFIHHKSLTSQGSIVYIPKLNQTRTLFQYIRMTRDVNLDRLESFQRSLNFCSCM